MMGHELARLELYGRLVAAREVLRRLERRWPSSTFEQIERQHVRVEQLSKRYNSRFGGDIDVE